ncbi:hypothetical protein BVX99_00745 [bacterium F16]|nr:hypothetical protein BVX99_00745 [bacterium F16]
MFRFFCTECENKLKAPENLVGQKVECAHCGKAITVPDPKSIDSGILNQKTNIIKTQQISRKALIDHSTILEPDLTENLVDLINQQVDADITTDVPKLDVPKLDVPKLDVPKLDVPKLDVPKLDVPKLDVPKLDVPKLDIPIATPEPTPAKPDIPIARPELMTAHAEGGKTRQDRLDYHDASIAEPAPPKQLSPSKFRAGTVVGNFEIGYHLGEGAMGQVFSAKQLSMDRQVALKIIPPEVMNEEAVAQFNNEVKMLAKLSHQNIVTAYEAGEDKGIYYLAMAFIEGMNLDDVLKEGAVPEEQALNLVIYIATALKYSWDQYKMIHLDIKPGNIMIDSQGTVKLMDLGIAKIPTGKEGDGDKTVLGTPRYMSPEQASGEPDLDWRSDQYSLGATLYHILTGEPPFPGDDPQDVMRLHISAPLRPPISINETISRETNEVIKRMMAKSRDRRFESWDGLITRLSEISLVLSRGRGASPRKGKGTDRQRAVKQTGKKTRMRIGKSAAVTYANPQPSSFSTKLTILIVIILAGLAVLGLLLTLGGKI